LNIEEQASISAEEWKPGYLLFDLGEKVDPVQFMAELKENPAVEYIQPDCGTGENTGADRKPGNENSQSSRN